MKSVPKYRLVAECEETRLLCVDRVRKRPRARVVDQERQQLLHDGELRSTFRTPGPVRVCGNTWESAIGVSQVGRGGLPGNAKHAQRVQLGSPARLFQAWHVGGIDLGPGWVGGKELEPRVDHVRLRQQSDFGEDHLRAQTGETSVNSVALHLSHDLSAEA